MADMRQLEFRPRHSRRISITKVSLSLANVDSAPVFFFFTSKFNQLAFFLDR